MLRDLCAGTLRAHPIMRALVRKNSAPGQTRADAYSRVVLHPKPVTLNPSILGNPT